tara:strand:- start:268 stop:498 length:231 start_codon:yes stop_codon:yes gene_type:complete
MSKNDLTPEQIKNIKEFEAKIPDEIKRLTEKVGDLTELINELRWDNYNPEYIEKKQQERFELNQEIEKLKSQYRSS